MLLWGSSLLMRGGSFTSKLFSCLLCNLDDGNNFPVSVQCFSHTCTYARIQLIDLERNVLC